MIYASSFTEALTRLTKQEAGAVALCAFDLQQDPTGNGKQMHRVERAADKGFWSVRVTRDLRIIVHRSGSTLLLAYAGHHDDAYRWAERKRLVPHERTGAMQFVEIAVSNSASTTMVDRMETGSSRPFAMLMDDALLDAGVPRDWLEAVRQTQADELFDLLDKLPAEAAEALLDVATGGRIEDHVAPKVTGDPFTHPDAQRRFRTVDNIEELRAALEQPFEKWAIFLHPAQRAIVERKWSGPVRVAGSAGTGKTIVALHRAVHLARADASARVLLTTFSKRLAVALSIKRDLLVQSDPVLRDRVTVMTLDQAAFEIYSRRFGQPTMASDAQVRAAIKAAQTSGFGGSLTAEFLFEEWDELVDAWNVTDSEAYAQIPRLGRRIRIGPLQRAAAWQVFAFVQQRLAERNVTTWAQLYARLTDWMRAEGGRSPYSHVVVDEAQDLSVAQARFLAAIGQQGNEAIFFAGDQGQRIFHLPFSWASLGIDIRGRSHALKVNYRTSHQIRTKADRLLPGVIVDVDGVEEGRFGTVSVFDGPEPSIVLAENEADEITHVARYLCECTADGMMPSDLAILVRSQGQLSRARAAVRSAGLKHDDTDSVSIILMHDAKGLEFRGVVVMACDDDVVPDGARIASIGDMAEMEAVYETERHLLYVACTRPRDRLMVSAIKPGSEFLEDLFPSRSRNA